MKIPPALLSQIGFAIGLLVVAFLPWERIVKSQRARHAAREAEKLK